jgi:hypothetical protein
VTRPPRPLTPRPTPLACALLALLPLLQGCPSDYSQLCPSGTHSEGLFDITLTYHALGSDECRVLRLSDGGPADAAFPSAPDPFVGALCSAPAGDGGPRPVLSLELPGNYARQSPLGSDGSFVWSTGNNPDAGTFNTSCNCQILFTETIAGSLSLQQPDAGFDLHDGGLATIGSFSARVSDDIGLFPGAAVPDGGCSCNIDGQHHCGAAFDLAGVRQ